MKIKKKRGSISTIIFSMKYIAKNGALKDLILSNLWIFFSAISGVILILQAAFVNNANDAYANKPGALHWTIVFLVILLSIKTIESIATVFSGNSSNRLWIVLKNKTNYELLSKAFKIKAKCFDDPETFNMFERTKFGSDKVIAAAQSSFGFLGLLLSLVSVIIAMISNDWVIMLVVVIGCIPLLISQVLISNMNYEKSLWDAPCKRREGYMYVFMISKGYFREMRMLGFFDYMMKKYTDSVSEYTKNNDKVAIKYTILNIISAIIRYGILAVALWMTVNNIIYNNAPIGSFVLAYGAIQSIQNGTGNLFKNLAIIRENSLYVNDYIDVMNLEDEDLKLAGSPVPEKMEIEFKNVTFSYPGSDREILKNFSVKFKDGEKVAIVGENGAGKSTFVALLLGLYEPQKGSITCNGVPIQDCLGVVRRAISCALQKRGFYEMTMEENVRIGDCFRDEIPFSEIEEASIKTGFDEPVRNMKKGYDTYFGYRVELANDLSGGEGQKMINARALLKKDARYLVLDEPTAALDPVAEADVYKGMNELIGDRGCLFISHRLGVATVVDRVIVIDDGKVIEDGTHEELLQNDGLYTQMWNSQAKWYVS